MPIKLEVTADTLDEFWNTLNGVSKGMPGAVPVDPTPAAPATRKPRAEKIEPLTAATAQNGPAETGSAPVTTSPAPTTVAPQETATSSTAAVSDVPVTEADLMAAANEAAKQAGPHKVKEYIAANFTKADGTPGTLKMTAPDQQAALVVALRKIAQKEITL